MKLLFDDVGLPAELVANCTFLILLSSLFGRVIVGWLAGVGSARNLSWWRPM